MVKRLHVMWLTVGLFVALPWCAAAQSDFDCGKVVMGKREMKSALGLVEKRYEEIKSLRAEFRQESYFAGLDAAEVSSGYVVFLKPGKMDWSYETPISQRFVADGETLWYYQPEDKQVTIADFRNAFDSDLPVSFLLGIGSLEERFVLRSACYNATGIVLELGPKSADPSLEEFRLLVRKDSYSPIGALIVDIGGNKTAIALESPKFNIELGDNQFRFPIPLGTDVIDRRGLSEPIVRPRLPIDEKELVPSAVPVK